mmetsp:Transcript_15451/g.42601  ORF Transcript_15451/g.42601 Transcript_15451/m.42601 type:complete len:291 (+) Transcript_15451:126-998(+)
MALAVVRCRQPLHSAMQHVLKQGCRTTASDLENVTLRYPLRCHLDMNGLLAMSGGHQLQAIGGLVYFQRACRADVDRVPARIVELLGEDDFRGGRGVGRVAHLECAGHRVEVNRVQHASNCSGVGTRQDFHVRGLARSVLPRHFTNIPKRPACGRLHRIEVRQHELHLGQAGRARANTAKLRHESSGAQARNVVLALLQGEPVVEMAELLEKRCCGPLAVRAHDAVYVIGHRRLRQEALFVANAPHRSVVHLSRRIEDERVRVRGLDYVMHALHVLAHMQLFGTTCFEEE